MLELPNISSPKKKPRTEYSEILLKGHTFRQSAHEEFCSALHDARTRVLDSYENGFIWKATEGELFQRRCNLSMIDPGSEGYLGNVRLRS